MPDENVTRDGFLGGRISLLQPKDGYRAGTDAVLLAAAVRAEPGQSVLELGCGAGAAALCLMARVPGLAVTGVEMQPLYVGLAKQNAKINDLPLEVVEGRIEEMPGEITARSFDHVVANPPYFETNSLTAPTSPAKKTAHAHGADALAIWITAARKRLRPGGSLTLIHRTDALPLIMAHIVDGFGDIDVFPITSRRVKPANRIVVCARKGRRTPMRLHPPLVMHDGPEHVRDGDDYSAAAKAILLEGGALF